MDANRDKLDYRTSSRPIASNKISKKSGLIFSLVMLFITFLATMMLSFEIIWILLAYVLINIAYSLKLKTIVVVDVVIISSGFLNKSLNELDEILNRYNITPTTVDDYEWNGFRGGVITGLSEKKKYVLDIWKYIYGNI